MIRRPPRSTLSSSSAASDVYKRQYQHRRHHPSSSPYCCGSSPSATASEPLWYGVRGRRSGEGQTTTMTSPATVRRDNDDEEDGSEWSTVNGDFGLSAARLRIVGRLRRDSSWDRTTATPSSTRRDHQRPTAMASHSQINGQTLLHLVCLILVSGSACCQIISKRWWQLMHHCN